MAATDNNPTAPNPTAPGPALARTPKERRTDSASVSRAFGEPIAAQGRTIIPVAMVAMSFRGGFWGRVQGVLGNAVAAQPPTNGSANGAAAANDGQGHGGMMRRMMVRPVGFIDVSSTGSRFAPIGRGRYVVLGIALAFVAGGFLRRRQRKMAKKS